MLRSLLAGNSGALTLDGTRTHIVGWRRVAVIDPGPSLPSHIDAVVRSVEEAGDGVSAVVLLTHSHPDHSEAAAAVAGRLGARIRGAEALSDGAVVSTDAGALRAHATPGHTRDHYCFELDAERILFCGDLMMGGLDTALVALPEGHLGDYLSSLERMRALAPREIRPAHGPAIMDPLVAIDRYIAHRHARADQVLKAVEGGAAGVDAIVAEVYGSGLEPSLHGAAAAAVRAYLEWLEETRRLGRQSPIR